MEWSTADTISTLSALAAIGSAAFAYKTYLATVDLKKQDYALQLQTANETLRALVRDLPKLLAEANRSRRSLMAYRGLLGGSVAIEWGARIEDLNQEVQALTARLPREEVRVSGIDSLRSLLVETHGYQVRALAVEAELQKALARDAADNAEIREAQRVGWGQSR